MIKVSVFTVVAQGDATSSFQGLDKAHRLAIFWLQTHPK
jgi:hypothetical protein